MNYLIITVTHYEKKYFSLCVGWERDINVGYCHGILLCCCVDSRTQKNFWLGIFPMGLNNYIYEAREHQWMDLELLLFFTLQFQNRFEWAGLWGSSEHNQRCVYLFTSYFNSTVVVFYDSIRNRTENAAVSTLAGSDLVWIGLHREKQWSDGSRSLFRHWAPGQPDSGQEEECVTARLNNSGRWSDENCSLGFPFICYKRSNVPCVYFCSHSTLVS